jgi:hypothetical protein
MFPSGLQIRQRFFAVHPQGYEASSGAALLGDLECGKGGVATTAGNQAWHPFLGRESAILEQLAEAFATAYVHVFGVRARAPTLDVNVALHQRVPPS